MRKNVANDVGGGVYNLFGGAVTVQNGSVVQDNEAEFGGGISSSSLSLTVNNSTLDSNQAWTSGGGLDLSGGTATLDGSVISANDAAAHGGGLYARAGTLTVTGAQFLANNALGTGSAVFTAAFGAGRVRVTGSCIVNNAAVAVYNSVSDPQIATGNWWGTAAGPGPVGPSAIGDTVSVNVDFSG